MISYAFVITKVSIDTSSIAGGYGAMGVL